MGAKKQEFPAPLLRAQERFSRWRKQHRPRTHIAEGLWREAVSLARRYGHNRTARALGLDYYSLGKRLKSAAKAKGGGKGPEQAFVEMFAPVGGPECSIELEDAGGAKLRICLKGVEVPDLTALSRDFWRGGA